MTLWRLEWLRLVRTRRAVALGAVFVVFGFLAPVLARFIEQLLGSAGTSGVRISVPDPVPADGIGGYVKNAVQVGVLVLTVIAAATFCFDAHPSLAIFYRTRIRRAGALVLPRYVVLAAATATAFVAGQLAAWYETAVLIGAPDVTGMLVSTGGMLLYLWFAIAVVALVAALVRRVIATVGIALAVLVLLPLLGALRGVHGWSPSRLTGAADELLRGTTQPMDYLAPAAVALVLTGALLLGAVRGFARPE